MSTSPRFGAGADGGVRQGGDLRPAHRRYAWNRRVASIGLDSNVAAEFNSLPGGTSPQSRQEIDKLAPRFKLGAR